MSHPRPDANGTGYVCEACGATFDSRASLARHIDDVGLVP